MSTVIFPTHEEVIRDIDVLKQVQNIKKAAFMNACDTNVLARDMRDSIIDDAKVLKKIKWVQNIDSKVQHKINQRIKVLKQQEANPYYNPALFEHLKSQILGRTARPHPAHRQPGKQPSSDTQGDLQSCWQESARNPLEACKADVVLGQLVDLEFRKNGVHHPQGSNRQLLGTQPKLQNLSPFHSGTNNTTVQSARSGLSHHLPDHPPPIHSDTDSKVGPTCNQKDLDYLKKLELKLNRPTNPVTKQTHLQTLNLNEYAKQQKIKGKKDCIMAEVIIEQLAREANGEYAAK